MLNAFAGIEWLPAPGITPDAPYYGLDAWAESLHIHFAATPEDALLLALKNAREKLAELEVMIRAGKQSAAGIAIERYAQMLDLMRAKLAVLAESRRAELTVRCATALLEHEYIVSTDYVDLPRNSRVVIARVIAVAGKHYQELAGALSRRARDALIFKEEEVRWSWEMAQAADAQGL